jgi:site-specific recombinase XerD
MQLTSYLFYLRARNLSPKTIKVTEEYLKPFLKNNDPLKATRADIEMWLGDLAQRCKPSTVWTAWRHLRGFYIWLEHEGDIEQNPMLSVPKPLVPPTDIAVLTPQQVQLLLETCGGKTLECRRDYAVVSLLLDTGLRLSEVTNLKTSDIGEDYTLRVFGKGRKWRTVALGTTSATALQRWLRVRNSKDDFLWSGKRGPLTNVGMRKMIQRRGAQAGIKLHPHVLRHTWVDNWLRNGGSEVDLARLAGWTSTRMAERYAQQRADQRALDAHRWVSPLDRIGVNKPSILFDGIFPPMIYRT